MRLKDTLELGTMGEDMGAMLVVNIPNSIDRTLLILADILVPDGETSD